MASAKRQKDKPETHRFLVKSGTVFTGVVESETKTDVILDVGRGKRSIITLAKSYIVSKDGQPFPVKRTASAKRAAARKDVPLVLTYDRDYSTARTVILFFDAPVSSAARKRLDALVPAPLRFVTEWVTPAILFAGTDEFFAVDVRIAYNAKARSSRNSKSRHSRTIASTRSSTRASTTSPPTVRCARSAKTSLRSSTLPTIRGTSPSPT